MKEVWIIYYFTEKPKQWVIDSVYDSYEKADARYREVQKLQDVTGVRLKMMEVK